MTALRPDAVADGRASADELHARATPAVSGMAPDTLYEIRVLGGLSRR